MGSVLMNVFVLNFLAGADDLVGILYNVKKYLEAVGEPAMLSIGAALLIYGGWKVLRAITGRQGQSGPQWGKAFLSIVFGGGLFFLGWKMNTRVGEDAQNTVNNLTGLVNLLGSVDLSSLGFKDVLMLLF